MSIKYVHTNIIAKDWRNLVDFYINEFKCKPILPERDLSGAWIDKITNINDVRIRGIHLELPGYENGPTLEIFSYEPENLNKETNVVNKQGFAHIAFHVDDVEEVLDHLLKEGGSRLGEITTKKYDGLGTLSVVYAKDPEDNIIEIQNWNKS
jgi:predicted enzyme related to lactoylglutathione lyase